jgi:hypothetical protein
MASVASSSKKFTQYIILHTLASFNKSKLILSTSNSFAEGPAKTAMTQEYRVWDDGLGNNLYLPFL